MRYFMKIWSKILSLFRFSLLVLLTLNISSCGFIYGEDGLIKSRTYDYVVANQTKELEIPPPLSHKDKVDFTVLPAIGEKAEQSIYGKELALGAPIQLLAVMDNTRVDRKSSMPAVLVVDQLEFIWQTATKFFEQHNITASLNDRENRVLISQWLAIDKKGVWLGLDGSEEPDEYRAKYKISVGEGEIKGEQKLIVQRIKSQKRLEDDSWGELPIFWRDSADMMNLLLSYYDTRIRIQDAHHRQQILVGFKVELGQDENGKAALITSAEKTLVWEKVPRVMRDMGFTIIDKDLRQHTYFMEYHPPEKGFFASLFESEASQLPLKDGAYQASVGELGEMQAISLRDGEGTVIEADILVKLYPDLSRLFGDRR